MAYTATSLVQRPKPLMKLKMPARVQSLTWLMFQLGKIICHRMKNTTTYNLCTFSDTRNSTYSFV